MNFHEPTDEQLIANIKQNKCSDSLIALTNRHQGLLVQIMGKYARVARCTGVTMQDFLDDSNLIVFDAVDKFDPGKNIKFTTWLGNTTKYYCLNSLNKQSRYLNNSNDDTFGLDLANDISNSEHIQRQIFAEHMEFIKNILSQIKDKRIERIINLRYFSGQIKKESFSSIGKTLGLSTQGVIDLHDTFIKFLREKMKAETNMDKI